MRLTTRELAAAVGGTLVGPDVVVDGASNDSRALRPGQLFVPLVAERDGHDFVTDAEQRGAAAYLTSRGAVPGVKATAIAVADTARALQQLGAWARGRVTGPVVGITGSAGKTSTKDLVAAVLAHQRRVHASEKSFNNEIGVPLTILDAPEGTEALVLEMGARGIGHIASLCAIARPTVGVVTLVAAAHVELFGSLDAVAQGKGELVEALPADGCAVLNHDDERVRAMAARTRARVLTFGRQGDVRAEKIELRDDLTSRFVAHTPWGSVAVTLGARGAHNIANALAALAVAGACGVSLDAAAALAHPTLSPWRMELHRTPAGAAVINDAYNANPASMRAALASLAALPARRRVAVLGPMAELGPDGAAEHRAIAATARERGIELVAVGTDAYGVAPEPSFDAVQARLGPLGPDDAVLVKGSRVAGLEVLARRLVAGVDAAEAPR